MNQHFNYLPQSVLPLQLDSEDIIFFSNNFNVGNVETIHIKNIKKS